MRIRNLRIAPEASFKEPPPSKHCHLIHEVIWKALSADGPDTLKNAHTLTFGLDGEGEKTTFTLRGTQSGRQFGVWFQCPWSNRLELIVRNFKGLRKICEQKLAEDIDDPAVLADEAIIALWTGFDIVCVWAELAIKKALPNRKLESWELWGTKLGRTVEVGSAVNEAFQVVGQMPLFLQPDGVTPIGAAASQ